MKKKFDNSNTVVFSVRLSSEDYGRLKKYAIKAGLKNSAAARELIIKGLNLDSSEEALPHAERVLRDSLSTILNAKLAGWEDVLMKTLKICTREELLFLLLANYLNPALNGHEFASIFKEANKGAYMILSGSKKVENYINTSAGSFDTNDDKIDPEEIKNILGDL